MVAKRAAWAVGLLVLANEIRGVAMAAPVALDMHRNGWVAEPWHYGAAALMLLPPVAVFAWKRHVRAQRIARRFKGG